MMAARDGLPLPPAHETDIPRVSHDDVEGHHCRWPCLSDVSQIVGSTPVFCGIEKIPGSSYCEVHFIRSSAGAATVRIEPMPRRVTAPFDNTKALDEMQTT